MRIEGADMFPFFRKAKAGKDASVVHNTAVRNELQELVALYPVEPLPALASTSSFPMVTTLEPFGLAAYHMSLMPRDSSLAELRNVIEHEDFRHEVEQSARFLSLRNPAGKTVSLCEQTEFNNVSLILITNSVQLIATLRQIDLAPPTPWEVFREVDPESLGSLQGEMAHWWNTYWAPFWNSLEKAEQITFLGRFDCPAEWREFIEFHDGINNQEVSP
jgi:hypothetical protein